MENFQGQELWEHPYLFGVVEQHAMTRRWLNAKGEIVVRLIPQWSMPGLFSPFRSVACPLGVWVNVIPRTIEEQEGYSFEKHHFYARNLQHENKEPVAVVRTVSELGRSWKWSAERPAGDWLKNGFDDSTWRSIGPTLAAAEPGLSESFWMRATINLPGDPAALSDPHLKVRFEGEFDLYLNGHWVKTVRRSSGGRYGGFWLPPAARGSLRSGENILAAQSFGSSEKSRLDVGLIDWR